MIPLGALLTQNLNMMSIPKNLISLSEFLDMKKMFESTLQPKMGKQETRSVWIPLDELKNYLAYVENEASKKGIKVSGIRFHMLAQTKANNQLTLALTSTYEEASKHVDFDPIFSSKEKPATLKSLESDNQKSEEKGGILNRMAPCPVICS